MIIMYLMTLLYILALCLSAGRTISLRYISIAVFGLGTLANVLICFSRYYHSWPLMPMYQTPVFVTAFIGLLVLGKIRKDTFRVRLLMFTVVVISLAVTLFPKDFYLPFLKSRTVFSHIFMLSGALGQAFFMAGGVEAACFIHNSGRVPFLNTKAMSEISRRTKVPSWDPSCIVWGFIFWTISMFSGEMWSYLGWGNPVVWDDATIVMSMATWFYYVALLHLYLLKPCDARKRAYAAVVGSLLVFVFNVLPNLGSFKIPNMKNLLVLLGA